jgi:hypothetical protein
MLTLMKKVLLLAGDSGMYDPNDMGTKEGKYALGRMALMTSDLYNPEERPEGLSGAERWRRQAQALRGVLYADAAALRAVERARGDPQSSASVCLPLGVL